MVEKAFTEKVAEINKVLDGYGDLAITSEEKKNKEGKVVKTFTGYKVQYVVDAVNEVIGPENWRWEHSEIEATRNPSGQSSKANVAITLYVRVKDEWFTKGPVTGDSLNPVEADAMKGALADGLKKSFAYWSIGSKAYRGELEPENKKSGKSKAKSSPDEGPPSDYFMQFCDLIEEAEVPDQLTIVGKEIAQAYKDGKITVDENRDLVARGKARRKELHP